MGNKLSETKFKEVCQSKDETFIKSQLSRRDYTPANLLIAAEYGNIHIVKLICKYIKLNIPYENGYKSESNKDTFSYLLKYYAYYMQAIHIANNHNHPHITQWIISDTSHHLYDKYTKYDCYLFSRMNHRNLINENTHIDVIHALILFKTRITLKEICEYNRLDWVRLAIQHGLQDYNDGLSSAVKHNHIEVVKLLIKQGATNMNECFRDYVAKTNNYEMAHVLMPYINGHNAILKEAITGQKIEMAQLLINQGANNFTECLYIAVRNSDVKAVDLLLKYKVDGFNECLKIAVEQCCIPIMRMLIKAGANNFAYLPSKLVAEYLNDNVNINNVYVDQLKQERARKQNVVQNFINSYAKNIRHYDLNITKIITEYIPYE